MNRLVRLSAFIALLIPIVLPAQNPGTETKGKKLLTPEIVMGGGRRGSGGPMKLTWRPASDEVSFLRFEGAGQQATLQFVLHDAATGSEKTIPTPAGQHAPNMFSYQWSPQGDSLLMEGGGDLWLAKPDGSEPRRLTDDPNEKESATFSPDGRQVAFVENNNLYVVNTSTGLLKQLTSDGSETLMNGKLDWVYEEELAQRASSPAFAWSPDSTKIAYLSLDDTPVPKYPLVHYLSDHVTLSEQRFPQPGDPNPRPGMHAVTTGPGEVQSWSYPLKDAAVEYLSPSFTWTPDSSTVAFSTLDRHQTDLVVHLWNPSSGADRKLIEATDPDWINSLDAPVFIDHGRRFLWVTEQDGWMHAYLYDADGKPIRQLGTGEWMIDHPLFSDVPLFQVDESGGWIYFTSTEPDPRERQVYRVRLESGEKERLTREPGTHGLTLAPSGKYWIDDFSSLTTPSETRIVKADGTVVATLHKGSNVWADYALGSTELVTVKAADGVPLYARLVKPPGFDPNKKYPVIVDIYGGPGVQLIRNYWGLTGADDQMFAEQGYVVWSLDNRGSAGRGHAFETAVFEHLGRHEVEDQLAGINYLKGLPFIDGARIGVHGWSYGGYMTLELMTHSDAFKCGAAGGPVTAWKFYDSIYTERYMREPSENASGYQDSSPLTSAGKLKGKLLIIHGADDDNVHLQNTMNFVEGLVKSHIPFELYVQPGERHGFGQPSSRLYLSERELEFFKSNL